jgi:hypothetical protein
MTRRILLLLAPVVTACGPAEPAATADNGVMSSVRGPTPEAPKGCRYQAERTPYLLSDAPEEERGPLLDGSLAILSEAVCKCADAKWPATVAVSITLYPQRGQIVANDVSFYGSYDNRATACVAPLAGQKKYTPPGGAPLPAPAEGEPPPEPAPSYGPEPVYNASINYNKR